VDLEEDSGVWARSAALRRTTSGRCARSCTRSCRCPRAGRRSAWRSSSSRRSARRRPRSSRRARREPTSDWICSTSTTTRGFSMTEKKVFYISLLYVVPTCGRGFPFFWRGISTCGEDFSTFWREEAIISLMSAFNLIISLFVILFWLIKDVIKIIIAL